jgi:hypothetical protein
MTEGPMKLASGQTRARARHGRASAKMGEASASGQTRARARHGRASAKMGEYGGHFWAPVPK